MVLNLTTINPNTFNGPNNGQAGGYAPHTEIVSASVDADLNKVLVDLDYHLSLFQIAYEKLDQIDLAELGGITGSQIVAALDGTNSKIPAANLDDLVVLAADLAAAIADHKLTASPPDMHPETSIKGTDLTYSATPVTLVTTCNNLLDELKNTRYQINRIVGKTTWIDAPDSSIAVLKSSLDTLIANLAAHTASSGAHLSPSVNAALGAAHSPSVGNPFATINDIADKGAGDMLRSIYDITGTGVVDKAEGLVSGSSIKSFTDIVNTVNNAISLHTSSINHTAYTDARAIGAINNDSDHSSTARHYYNDLIGKPASIPASSFTSSDVSNLRNGSLANGTTPWANKADLLGGVVPAYQLQNVRVINGTATNWIETPLTKTYFSNSNPGSVDSTIFGPAIIYGGIGFKSKDYGYLCINVGAGMVNCVMSPEIVGGLYGHNNLQVWTCPSVYIQAGTIFQIIAGSTFGPSSSGSYYGAGYHLQYRQL